MEQIFSGLLIILFDLTLTIYGLHIDLFPDFIGYILIYLGVNKLIDQSELFKEAKKTSAIMVVISLLSVFLFASDKTQHTFFYGTFAVVSMLLYLWITYIIVGAVMDMEDKTDSDLKSERLHILWKFMALSQIACCLVFIFPMLSAILAIVNTIFNLAYIIAFSQSNEAYKKL